MNDTEVIECEVYALTPEFNIAHIRSDDNHNYVFNRKTPGINLSDVKEGQRYRCVVTLRLPRVISAELL